MCRSRGVGSRPSSTTLPRRCPPYPAAVPNQMGCAGSKQDAAEPVKEVGVKVEFDANATTPAAPVKPDAVEPKDALGVLPAALDFNRQTPATEDLSEMSAPATQKPSSDFNRRMSNPVVSSAKQYSSMSDLHSHTSGDHVRLSDGRPMSPPLRSSALRNSSRPLASVAVWPSARDNFQGQGKCRMAAWKEQQNKARRRTMARRPSGRTLHVPLILI